MDPLSIIFVRILWPYFFFLVMFLGYLSFLIFSKEWNPVSVIVFFIPLICLNSYVKKLSSFWIFSIFILIIILLLSFIGSTSVIFGILLSLLNTIFSFLGKHIISTKKVSIPDSFEVEFKINLEYFDSDSLSLSQQLPQT